MRLLIIGDPHGKLPGRIPKNVDLVLITGDIGNADLARKRFFENLKREKKGLAEIPETAEFVRKSHLEIYNSSLRIVKRLAKIAPVYFILGNVGMYDAEVRKESKKLGVKLPLLVSGLKNVKNVRMISNRFVNFNGLRIGGLEYFLCESWVREFDRKNKERMKRAKKESAKARRILRWFGKNKIDILLCHQPPYGILDKVNSEFTPKDWRGKHAGSKVILDFIKKYKNLKYVFCGHIHEGKGRKKIGKTEVINAGFNGDYLVVDVQ